MSESLILSTGATNAILFDFSVHWPLYALFTLLVLILVAVDMSFSQKLHEPPPVRQALLWSMLWVLVGCAVGFGLYGYAFWHLQDWALAKRCALEYFTGYVVEKSLAVDNIFVFIVIFKTLHIPMRLQRRVLFYGILGALLFRAAFIALGSYWFQYHWVLLFFGVLLILSGLKILYVSVKELRYESEKNEASPLVVWLSRHLPVFDKPNEEHFFVYSQSKWHVTPLFVALVAIECSDIIFALDSVPAIFALTKEPLIVFTSNICAILGLRAIYFLLADFMHRFKFLSFGLSGILIFIGIKMLWLNPLYQGHFPITWSLMIIFGFLALAVLASLIDRSKKSKGASL